MAVQAISIVLGILYLSGHTVAWSQVTADTYKKGLTMIRSAESTCEDNTPADWSHIRDVADEGPWHVKRNETDASSIPGATDGIPDGVFNKLTVERVLTEADKVHFNTTVASVYGMWFDYSNGVVIGFSSFRFNDTSINMSEIVVALWKFHFEGLHQPIPQIRKLFRYHIENPDTKRVVAEVSTAVGFEFTGDSSRKTLKLSTPVYNDVIGF